MAQRMLLLDVGVLDVVFGKGVLSTVSYVRTTKDVVINRATMSQ